MSTLNQHIQEIKQEIAKMTKDGHLVDFEMISCAGAIECECDQIIIIDNENEGRTNEA